MKKLFLMFAAVAAMTFASCSQTSEKNDAENKEAEEVKTEEVAQQKSLKEIIDELKNCDSEEGAQGLVAKAEQLATDLAKEGKLDEAKKYLEEVKTVIGEKYPAVASACDTAISGLEKVASLQEAKDAAGEAVENTKDAASAAVEGAKEAANSAVEGTKAAASNAVEGAKNAVNSAAESTKNAAGAAVEGAKEKVNDVVNAIKK